MRDLFTFDEKPPRDAREATAGKVAAIVRRLPAADGDLILRLAQQVARKRARR